LLSPYVPMLFQGEEWSASSPFLYFVDFEAEPDLAAAIVKGRQSEFANFGWQPDQVMDPTNENAFHLSKLYWNDISATAHAEMLEWYRELIHLRRTCSGFTSLEPPSVHFSEVDRWLRIERPSATIICNFANERRCVPLEAKKNTHLLLASRPAALTDSDKIRLLPESVVVLGGEM